MSFHFHKTGGTVLNSAGESDEGVYLTLTVALTLKSPASAPRLHCRV